MLPKHRRLIALMKHPDYEYDKFSRSFTFNHHAHKNKRLAVLESALGEDSAAAVAKRLIESGNVNSKNELGETPLHLAVKKTNHQIIKYLLRTRKADVNATNKSGETPLKYAVRSENDKSVKLLIAHGANVNHIDRKGQSALHVACICRNNYNIIKILLKNGSDVNVFDGPETEFSPITNLLFMGNSDWKGKNQALNQLLKYSGFDKITDGLDALIFGINTDWNFRKMILAQIALLQAFDRHVNKNVLNLVNSSEYKDYFSQCSQELDKAKTTLVPNTSVTFFDVLIDNECKIVDDCDNKNMLDDLKDFNFEQEFPVYEIGMKCNLFKRNRAADASGSYPVPSYGPIRVVVENFLDSLAEEDDSSNSAC